MFLSALMIFGVLTAIVVVAITVMLNRESERDIAVRRSRNKRRDHESVNALPPENASIRDSEKG